MMQKRYKVKDTGAQRIRGTIVCVFSEDTFLWVYPANIVRPTSFFSSDVHNVEWRDLEEMSIINEIGGELL